jgi:hypothetical protein
VSSTNETDVRHQQPGSNTAEGLATAESWRTLLERFSHIVLVANSDAVDLPKLRQDIPETALFVFFNKVYKVLDEPFRGHALLVARSGTMGANIVHRREVDDVLKFFPGPDFLGIMNLRVNEEERLSRAADFNGAPAGHVDLASFFTDFYPAGKLPTSGFALALWLSDLRLPGTIMLCGFSARRSEKWKVFDVHDWTFEQVFLRLFARLGKIVIQGGAEISPYAALAKRFPDVPPAEIALVAAEVLSERLENANNQIDRLMSITKGLRSIDSFFRRFKPKTRKQKFLESQQKEG